MSNKEDILKELEKLYEQLNLVRNIREIPSMKLRAEMNLKKIKTRIENLKKQLETL